MINSNQKARVVIYKELTLALGTLIKQYHAENCRIHEVSRGIFTVTSPAADISSFTHWLTANGFTFEREY